MRLPIHLLFACLCLASTSCTVYHRVAVAPSAPLPVPAKPALVYAVSTAADTPRVWLVEQARLDAEGLHGRFFEVQGERAHTLRTTTDPAWCARLNGTTLYTTSGAWAPPKQDGLPATIPLALLTGAERIELDAKRSRKKAWVGVGITVGVSAALVGLMLTAAYDSYYD